MPQVAARAQRPQEVGRAPAVLMEDRAYWKSEGVTTWDSPGVAMAPMISEAS